LHFATASTTTVTIVFTLTVTQSIQPTLLIETRTSSGTGISTQVTITGSDSSSRMITTDSSGNYIFAAGVLTEGVTYTASATINSDPLSASVILGGNSVIVLEPTPSPFLTPQFPLGGLASLLVAMAAFTVYAMRKRRGAATPGTLERIILSIQRQVVHRFYRSASANQVRRLNCLEFAENKIV
jgi:hypothetical protein